jgi:hypothetical protein
MTDQPGGIVEHQDRLEAVVIVMRVGQPLGGFSRQQAQLLVAADAVGHAIGAAGAKVSSTSRTIRSGTFVKEPVYCSTSASAMRSRARTSDLFSMREMVGSEQRSGSDGSRSVAILKTGTWRKLLASLPSS